MKTPVTLLLVLSLIAAPYRISAVDRTNPDNGKDSVVVACVVLVIGAVVVYGLWKLCKKIPGPPATPPPPPTNAPPAGTNTNRNGTVGKASWVLPRIHLPDTDLHDWPDWQIAVAAFEHSDDCLHWTRCLYVTNWFSGSNIICLAADTNGPVATNWLTVSGPNAEVICDFGNLTALLPEPDKRFYRMVELP